MSRANAAGPLRVKTGAKIPKRGRGSPKRTPWLSTMNQRDFGFLQKLFDARHIGAFGQPDAARVATETFAVVIASDHDLGADRFRIIGHQRQVTVCRSAGDDPRACQRSWNLRNALMRLRPYLSTKTSRQFSRPVMIEPGQFVESLIETRAVDFLTAKLEEFVERADVAILQERIHEHRAQGRRDRHGEMEIDAVVEKSIHQC